MISTLLAGAGLSTSSGLNAYLPLLILALADRLGSAVDLDRPFSWISSGGGLLVLLLILPIELVGDKIPRLDHYNDRLHTVLRPLAGAFCFAAIASQHEHLHVWLAAVLGLALAAVVHFWKMRSRVAITAATAGLGNPIVSMLEDGLAIVLAICSAFVPVANAVAIPLALVILRRTYRRMATGESRTIRMFQPKKGP
ncbi:MAG: DUF4126 domain-containing protein [Chloroflexia bacterium]|nr:DUF4126 domain-containing protein [Chloroflexia bacterium]